MSLARARPGLLPLAAWGPRWLPGPRPLPDPPAPTGPLPNRSQVRALAAAAGLAPAGRRDSQGICFLGKARGGAPPPCCTRGIALVISSSSSHPKPPFMGGAFVPFTAREALPPTHPPNPNLPPPLLPNPPPTNPPQVRFPEFVREHLGAWPGPLVDADAPADANADGGGAPGGGALLGVHEGYWFYTVGQRAGIRLPGGPWCVPRSRRRPSALRGLRGFSGGAGAGRGTLSPNTPL
jgi:hypothetical protein